LEHLQTHPNPEIYDLTVNLLENYFGAQVVEDLVIEDIQPDQNGMENTDFDF